MKNTESAGNGRTARRAAGTASEQDQPEHGIPQIDSTVLLGAAGRVVIEHHGQRYELRETRYGKLILTK